MISLRREMNESELSAKKFAELLKAFKVVALAVSKTALPANPELSQKCRKHLEAAITLIDSLPSDAIDSAGNVAVNEIEQICSSNGAALQERDSAIKSIVTLVANTVRGFNGDCEGHTSNLTKLADQFDALSRVKDPDELRRRLQTGVGTLRGSVEEMRRDNEASLRRFDSQMSAFQQRLEMARKDNGIDRLTGLGSRLEASRHLRTVASRHQPICLQLFDIEGFGAINQQHGVLFGDQLLKALAHMVRTTLADQDGLFRWAADEFLVIAEGKVDWRSAQCLEIRRTFSGKRYLTVKEGVKVPLNADVAYGVAQYVPGEDIEDAYRRARQVLEQNRKRPPQ